MPVGFNGSGDYLRRTANLPGSTAFTICGWAMVRSVRAGQFQYFAGMDDGSANWLLLGYDDAGAFEISATTGGGANFASNPTTNTWFFFAISCSGTGATAFAGYYAHAGNSFTTATTTGQSFTPTGLYLGNDGFDEYCDVILGPVKVFDAVLTSDELYAEMYRISPARFANLNFWTPLWSSSDVNDYSGNGRNLTSAGTLTSESMPPIGYGAKVIALPYVAAGGTTYPQSVAGGISPAGGLTKQAGKALAGAISPAGALARRTAKSLAGAISPAGALVKRTAKSFSGAISPSGTVSAIKTALVSLSGAISPSGALARRTGKVLSGAISPAGALVKRTARSFGGAISPAGSLAALRTILKSIGGSISPSGALSRSIRFNVAGAIAPAGGLVKRISKVLSGVLSFVGAAVGVSSTPGATIRRAELHLNSRSFSLTVADRATSLHLESRSFSLTLEEQ